jgi:hypothetical protein
MKSKFLLPIIFIFIILSVLINTFIKSKNEHEKSYNFIITKIEKTPTKTLEFYNKKEKIVFWNFIVSSSNDVKIGDLIIKEKCSNILFIYKKNKKMKFEKHSFIKFSGIFPSELFCD